MLFCNLIGSCRTRDHFRESPLRFGGSGYHYVASWAAMRLEQGVDYRLAVRALGIGVTNKTAIKMEAEALFAAVGRALFAPSVSCVS